MTDSEKLQQAAEKYKAGRDREFPCNRKVTKRERKPSILEAHTKAVREKRFQRLREAE